jgi:hypothetical protein
LLDACAREAEGREAAPTMARRGLGSSRSSRREILTVRKNAIAQSRKTPVAMTTKAQGLCCSLLSPRLSVLIR